MILARRLLAVLGALTLVAATLALAASSSEAAGQTVTIGDTLSPRQLTVAPGTTVTWVNDDDERHRMRSEDARDGLEFDSGNIEPGERWSYTFRTTGEVSYSDHEDDEDRGYFGTVTVERGGGSGSGGGSGEAGDGGSAPAAMKASVSIGDNFAPRRVTIAAGGTVTWSNKDGEPHTATADDGSFDSGNLNGGQTWSHTFDKPGTYSYSCRYHPDMSGVVEVVDSSGEAPPPGGSGGHAPPRPVGDGAGVASGPAGGGHGGGGTAEGGAAAGETSTTQEHRVVVTDSGFSPTVLNARVGDTVTWVNTGQAPHTVTGGPWDAEIIPGQRFTTVLRRQGSIDYVCTYHPSMKGTVKVAAAPAGADPRPSPDTGVSGRPKASTGSASADSRHGGHGEGSAPSADPEAGAQNHTVNIVDFLYDPQTLQARVGDTVTFVNQDAAPHTATATDDSFDSGNLDQGQRWTLKLEEVGTVEYLCTYHPDMRGTLVVKAAGAKIAPVTAGSAAGGADTADASSAGRIAGFTSGWLALLAFLAGLQLQSRLTSRRRMSNQV